MVVFSKMISIAAVRTYSDICVCLSQRVLIFSNVYFYRSENVLSNSNSWACLCLARHCIAPNLHEPWACLNTPLGV